MGTKLTHAPVFFTLAQVRFNPVWLLDEFASSIQDELRRLGYPDARKETIATIDVAKMVGPGQTYALEQTHRYICNDRTGVAGFVLQHNALTYSTTEYDVFDKFLDEFSKGLKVVNAALGLDYSDRVGVRYLDAIMPRAEETVATYIRPELLGLYGQFDGALLHTFSESVTDTSACRVVARAVVVRGKVGLPPDLQEGPLKLAARFSEYEGEHAILDTDCYSERRQKFEVPSLERELKTIQSVASDVFKAAITAKAKKVWA